MNQELLNKIKNGVAKEQGFSGWDTIYTMATTDRLWPEVCDRYSKAYAKECIKASLEKAAWNAGIHSTITPIAKSSITSESNIVLL